MEQTPPLAVPADYARLRTEPLSGAEIVKAIYKGMQIEVARNGKVSNVSRHLIKNAALWVKLNARIGNHRAWIAFW